MIQCSFILLTFISPSTQDKADIINILDTNTIHKTNADIHKCINKIFSLLKLNNKFTKQTEMQPLLTMHNDLVNIAEKYYRVYDDIKNRVHVINNTINPKRRFNVANDTKTHTHNYFIYSKELIASQDFKKMEEVNDIGLEHNKTDNIITKVAKSNELDEISEINDYIVKENQSGVYLDDSIENYTQINYVNETNFINETNEVLSAEFVQKFIAKLNTLSAKDFTEKYRDPNLNLFEGYNNDYRKRFRGDLKVWIPPNSSEGIHNDTMRRVYRGRRSVIKNYPFIVSVHIMGQFMCAGSIINKDLIVTAASCLQIAYNNRMYRENPQSVLIRAGSSFANTMGELIAIIEIYFHPSYNPTTLANNVAIARMERHLKFRYRQRRIRRIEYDREANILPDNVNAVTILGWGATTETGLVDPVQKLLVSHLDVYNAKECKSIYTRHYVNGRHFCGGFTSKGGGACNKDVGAPGIIGGILTGIVSFGPPICGTVDAPTVFTKLGYYADWIDEIVNMEPETIYRQTTTTQHPKIRITRNRKPAIQNNKPIVPTTGSPEPINLVTVYPEEISLLRKVIDDMLIGNDTLVDDLLYGGLFDDLNEFFSTTTKKVDIANHPLINKSIIIPPELFENDDENQAESTIVLTTYARPIVDGTTQPLPHGFVTDTPADLYDKIKELEKEMGTKTSPNTQYIPILSLESEISAEKKLVRFNELLDSNDESTESSNYENDKSNSYEGMSIDMGITKLHHIVLKTITRVKKK
ncbi:hypothetical protein K1T71_013137 [Dendrolimus kikuchii]|uniref:Uncharacterized protein n=1 Tax=Dendrolimus kikuchii TaxID=765133 RepID=A0ACC1CJ37_9NEOP|nr:hypothetical protein K1T71_013137 [Dendrolimus kikuchii]